MGRQSTYSHDRNASGVSEIKLQIRRRETPTLPVDRRAQVKQSYFRFLPFVPAEVTCLAFEEASGGKNPRLLSA